MGGRAGGAATAGVRVGRALALGDGEIVPAVQDGLLAEVGETLPVGGNPLLYHPLPLTNTENQTSQCDHNFPHNDNTQPGPLLLTNRLAPDILPFIFVKVLEIYIIIYTNTIIYHYHKSYFYSYFVL